MPKFITEASMGDITRCTLALIVGIATAWLVSTGQPIPGEWSLVTGAVFGFYFGMEVPKGRGGGPAGGTP